MEIESLEYGRIELEKPKCSGFPAAQSLHRRMDAIESALRHENGMLRQELADLRNSIPTLIAMQIESYQVSKLELND